MRLGGGRNGVLSSHLPWGDPRRGWDFVSAGRGDVPWEDCFRALRAIGYDGPISVEWEDAGMDRLHGAPEALEYLRRFDFEPPTASFDAAFRPPLEVEGAPAPVTKTRDAQHGDHRQPTREVGEWWAKQTGAGIVDLHAWYSW